MCVSSLARKIMILLSFIVFVSTGNSWAQDVPESAIRDTSETEFSEEEYAINQRMISGNRFYKENKYDEAEKEYLLVFEIDDKYAPAYFQLGKVYIQLGDLVKSADYLKKALMFDPENDKYKKEFNNLVGMYFNEANFLIKKGDYIKAREKLNTVIKFDPDYAEAYYLRGYI
ncbi:MAG: tetratricopeptide repeat protein, partial [Fidelibacterota bacterium]